MKRFGGLSFLKIFKFGANFRLKFELDLKYRSNFSKTFKKSETLIWEFYLDIFITLLKLLVNLPMIG
jgi:hypothetical protein